MQYRYQMQEYLFKSKDRIIIITSIYSLEFEKGYGPTRYDDNHRHGIRVHDNAPTSPKSFERFRHDAYRSDPFKKEYFRRASREHSRSPLHREYQIPNSPISGS